MNKNQVFLDWKKKKINWKKYDFFEVLEKENIFEFIWTGRDRLTLFSRQFLTVKMNESAEKVFSESSVEKKKTNCCGIEIGIRELKIRLTGQKGEKKDASKVHRSYP